MAEQQTIAKEEIPSSPDDAVNPTQESIPQKIARSLGYACASLIFAIPIVVGTVFRSRTKK